MGAASLRQSRQLTRNVAFTKIDAVGAMEQVGHTERMQVQSSDGRNCIGIKLMVVHVVLVQEASKSKRKLVNNVEIRQRVRGDETDQVVPEYGDLEQM